MTNSIMTWSPLLVSISTTLLLIVKLTGQKCVTCYAKAYCLCIRADAVTNNVSVYLVTEHARNNYGTCVHFACVLKYVVVKDNCHWSLLKIVLILRKHEPGWLSVCQLV